MILPKERDPRLITIRRGGTLTDAHHHLLALWAAMCAEHVLHHFEAAAPGDDRPRQAIELTRAWTRGEVKMTKAHDFAFVANAAGRDLSGAAKFAALSAGQAVAVAHVAAHDLGAAAYAIRAARAAAPKGEEDRTASANATGSGRSCPMRFGRLCLTIRRRAMRSAGPSSNRRRAIRRPVAALAETACGRRRPPAS